MAMALGSWDQICCRLWAELGTWGTCQRMCGVFGQLSPEQGQCFPGCKDTLEWGWILLSIWTLLGSAWLLFVVLSKTDVTNSPSQTAHREFSHLGKGVSGIQWKTETERVGVWALWWAEMMYLTSCSAQALSPILDKTPLLLWTGYVGVLDYISCPICFASDEN